MSVALVFRATDAAANAVNSNSMNWAITAAGDPVAIALVAATTGWWDFEQNDGTNQFLDSKNTNHLTAYNNAATTTAAQSTASGLIGRGMQNANAETSRTAYVPRANTALDLTNTSWTFGGWFKLPQITFASTRYIMGRVGSLGGGSSIVAYLFQSGTDNQLRFGATTDGSTVILTAGTPVGSGNPYYFITGTLDRANNLLRFRMRNGTAGSSPSTVNANQTVAFPGALYTAANIANFCIWNGLASNTTYVSGSRTPVEASADMCFFLSKAISDAEADLLYNAGIGLTYAQLLTLAGM